MATYKVYKMFDNGEYVTEGTSFELSKLVGMNQTCFHNYVGKNKYQKRYTFEYSCEKEKPKKAKQKMPEPSDHEKKLEWLYSHLKYKGNAFSIDDGSEYRNELAEKEIHFTVRPCFDGVGYILTAQ